MEHIVVVGTTYCGTCQKNVDVHEDLRFPGATYRANHTMTLNNPLKDIATCWGSLGWVREFERV